MPPVATLSPECPALSIDEAGLADIRCDYELACFKETNTQDRKFEDVVKSAEPAAVLVLVY